MHEDLRNAVRSLLKAPTFTAVALAVLALGIGAGTAIFSVVDAVVLRGLPFDEHDRLAVVLEHDTQRPNTFGDGMTTPQTYADWRTLNESFDGLAVFGGWSFRLRNENGEPADARGQAVSHEFFPVLRIAPVLGRAFTKDDEVQGRHRVAMLSYGFWQRRFGGDPGVIGRTIELSEQSWEIVGVLPRDFSWPVASDRPSEIFCPITYREEDKIRGGSRNYNWFAVGRLKPGISLQQATENMNGLMIRFEEEHPKFSPGRRARVVSLHEHLVGRVRPWMLMLLAAVALVLLIACANVANLMLARATVRSREIGIRAALGASRGRLVRGLLVEGVVLAGLGALAGLALGWAGVQLLTAWLPAGIPRVADIGLDLRVLGVAVAATLATGVFFGIVPAVHSTRPDLTSALKDNGRANTAGTGSQRLRSALVVAEVALAVVLLVGAGLFIGSFMKLMSVDTGFDYRNVIALSVGVRLEGNDFQGALKRGGPYAQQMIDAVSRVPGVGSVGAVSGGLPLTGSWSRTTVTMPDRGELKGDDDSIDRRVVSANYLQTLRIPLMRGRYLTDQDREGAPPVMVVNEAATRKYWPGEEALGKRLILNKKEYTIVGIVRDVRHLGPEKPVRQECYVPLAQDGVISVSLVARTTGDPLATLAAVKSAIWSVNKDQRLTGDTVTLEGYMDRLIAQRRFNMALLALFGILGLVIAAVGIYGVMAYIVAQRTNEIGIRMALGATRGNVVSMVLRRSALLIVAGLAIGGTAAWSLSSRVGTFLFEVQPNDLGIFAAALATLAASGLAASMIPARRAASVDPLVALRTE
jgi:putative ABC transport system permease protein